MGDIAGNVGPQKMGPWCFLECQAEELGLGPGPGPGPGPGSGPGKLLREQGLPLPGLSWEMEAAVMKFT